MELNLRNKKLSALEAILFSCADAVSVSEISGALEISEGEAFELLVQLKKEYDSERRGFKIIQMEDAFQICSREDYYDVIRRVAEPRQMQGLSGAALETLSIVAYHQPITRSRIDFIRGVDSSGSLGRLTGRGLVDEVGRLDAPGRPILYGTTDEFLRCFGLESLSRLPVVECVPEQRNFLEENEA